MRTDAVPAHRKLGNDQYTINLKLLSDASNTDEDADADVGAWVLL